MTELIKITTNESGSQVVSARELHQFLEITTPISMWMPRMIEYGFEEGVDYEAINIFVNASNNIGGTNKEVYVNRNCIFLFSLYISIKTGCLL